MGASLDVARDVVIEGRPVDIASSNGLHTLDPGMASMELGQASRSVLRWDDEPFAEQEAPVHHA